LHQHAQIQQLLMFRPAQLTLTDVTFNLNISEKVQFTINVSVN
jgi:hypothetical protein